MSAPTLPPGAREQTGSSRTAALRQWLAHPVAPYYLLIGSAGLLLAIGLVMVLSASGVAALRDFDDSYYFLKRQLMFVGIGLVAAAVVARTPIRVIRLAAWPLIIGSIGLLLLTYVPGFGVEVNGSTNWLSFGGPFRIQPSEVGKLAIVVWGAHVYAGKGRRIAEIRHLAIPVWLGAGAIVALTVGQRDLGTAIVLSVIVLGLMWVAGVPGWLMAGMGAAGAVIGGYFVWTEEYRRDRILSFLDPFADRLDTGYQAVASIYAFGSGGWTGRGFMQGTQSRLNFLPEKQTDFIFTTLAEEFGFLGAITLLILYLLIVGFCIISALLNKDRFSSLLILGIAVAFFLYFAVNMAMVIGLAPVVGVPLPLVSYGGSAMIVILAGFGLVQSAHVHRPR